MKYVILGAGLLGVTTAYVLASRGHEVEVIDRAALGAAETSFANGGQLSFSHAEPWANPSVLPKIFKWMFRDDAPLVFRLRADPAMIAWGMSFLRNCTAARAHENSKNILRLGLYSKKKTEQIRTETGVLFDHLDKGILHIFSDAKEYAHAIAQSAYQETLGCHEDIVDTATCLAMEPALAHSTKPIVGGIHAPLDESGDAHDFCLNLIAYCKEKFRTRFHFNTTIESILNDAGKITGIKTNSGEIKGDGYIVATGSYSPRLLKPLGIRIPVYPMKGYSITLPATDGTPSMSITDTELKLVYSRLGNRLRIAGTAEFAGHNTSIPEHRISPILRAVHTMFPKADVSNPQTWSCLRPSTPDGPPIIGKTKYENLFLNTGHGTLGWTQAAGSAFILSDIIEGRSPEIDMSGLTMERYS